VTVSVDTLKTELSQLSPRERAELARYLTESLDDGEDADAEAAWDAELARRMQQISDGTAIGEPAEKVLRDLQAKYA
jgi:putative addiction module component (TIGR02574 family)